MTDALIVELSHPSHAKILFKNPTSSSSPSAPELMAGVIFGQRVHGQTGSAIPHLSQTKGLHALGDHGVFDPGQKTSAQRADGDEGRDGSK